MIISDVMKLQYPMIKNKESRKLVLSKTVFDRSMA